MSLKDSMIRGLAVYGLSSMSQCGRANSSTLVDLINEANKKLAEPSAPVRNPIRLATDPITTKLKQQSQSRSRRCANER